MLHHKSGLHRGPNLLIYFERFLEEKLCIFFCVYLTPSVTSSGILYNSQLAEGTEP